MNTLMYILVSLAKFIFLIFCKGSEPVISSIIFPNGSNMCSYDGSPLSLTMTFTLMVQTACVQQPSPVRKVVKTLYQVSVVTTTLPNKIRNCSTVRATQKPSPTDLPSRQWLYYKTPVNPKEIGTFSPSCTSFDWDKINFLPSSCVLVLAGIVNSLHCTYYGAVFQICVGNC